MCSARYSSSCTMYKKLAKVVRTRLGKQQAISTFSLDHITSYVTDLSKCCRNKYCFSIACMIVPQSFPTRGGGGAQLIFVKISAAGKARPPKFLRHAPLSRSHRATALEKDRWVRQGKCYLRQSCRNAHAMSSGSTCALHARLLLCAECE